MQITDPVADMLTRIRNANSAKHDTVDVPASNLKKDIAKILLDEGYIKAYTVEEDGKQGMIHITLKYLGNKAKSLRSSGKEVTVCPESAKCLSLYRPASK